MADTASTPQGSDKRHHRGAEMTSWIVGVFLIVLGVAFFLEQSGYVVLTGNWWAIFIYLAAFASFANAWRSYRAHGEFGRAATGSLIWGLVFTVVASIFVFNLLWDTWWPMILVAIGVGIVVGYVLNATTKHSEEPRPPAAIDSVAAVAPPAEPAAPAPAVPAAPVPPPAPPLPAEAATPTPDVTAPNE